MLKTFASVSCTHLSGSGSITYSPRANILVLPTLIQVTHPTARPLLILAAGSSMHWCLTTRLYNVTMISQWCENRFGLWPLQGPPTLPSFLMLKWCPPQVCSLVEPPTRYSFPPRFRQVFTFFSPLSLPLYLSQSFPLTFCFSPSPSFIIYQFLLLFLHFSPFSLFPFMFSLYYSDTSPLVPLYLSLVLTDHTHLLWISVLLNCSLLLSPSSLKFSPILQSALLCSLVSQPCMW